MGRNILLIENFLNSIGPVFRIILSIVIQIGFVFFSVYLSSLTIAYLSDATRGRLVVTGVVQGYRTKLLRSPPKYPRHIKLVLIPFRKFVSNGVELCSKEVDVLASLYNLFTNFMDGLGWEGFSRTFEPAKKVWPSILSYN